ncbi:SusC/RagA family TonB-linked outer membrane protein [Mucilaginibacter pedocola]|uniref:SusC/RagA family TonB-linked outer membrane protein n=1 Tax=Mucilaginibacter pedocola TaxID=1792845 RepID=A0A1S9P776_9SPHI|nr:TonB-dependent receptor [Mucilaginibacter pedocola]OOQ56813.1 SusC/RagA family TonB-linked outer membrane protein [Mucilaginibacter pedocola]
MRKIILFFQIILTLLPAALYAQNIAITGKVRDLTGVLPGVSVVEKGLPTNGTTSDVNGRFTLTLRGQSRTVIVRFVGYVTREIKVDGTKPLDLILQTSTNSIDEVSVVAYGTRKRITTTGAVSSISAAEIRTVPTANVQNALTGKLPGFFSQQASGQPGKDASDFFIRGVSSLNADGNKPLIIVDDIEYNYDQLQQINVNEIESISILKDASTTAIYGIKGANGVLVVTTRRGKGGAPKFNLRVEGGSAEPTRTPKFLNAYDAAVLITEAQINDAKTDPQPKPPTFTAADLEHFRTGDDPYGHPDVNWYDKIFKKNSYQANTNLDISGGTNNLKYFISGGALNQTGLVRDFNDPQALVNTNYYFRRYNFRSNLDLKVNKTLDLRLDVTTRFTDLNQPYNQNAVGEIYNFTKQTPFTAPYLNPNGTYSYAYSNFNPDHLPTLNARLATGGYQRSRRTDFNFLFGATQKLDFITDGLSATGRIAYSSVEQYTKQIFNEGIPSYHYDPVTDSYSLRPGATYVYQTYGLTGNTDMNTNNYNLQVYLNYDRTFSNTHHFSAMALFNQTSNTLYAFPLLGTELVAVPQKFRGVSGKLSYDYKQKYLIDFNIAYNGTDRFAANHRYGTFPAVSVGYNLVKEDFFKDALPMFSLFKLRGSYGMVGSDAAPGNRYVYNQVYTQGAQYPFGQTPQPYTGITEGALSNGTVVWERAKKLDIGLDMNLFRDAVSVTVDYFYDQRYSQLIKPGSVPLILGVDLPAVNLGRTRNQGFDGSVSYHGNAGKVQYNAGLVFSYAKNKILFQDEATPAYPWLSATGHPIGQQFGYHSLGFYSAEDIAAIDAYKAAHQGSNAGNPIAIPDNGLPLQPGDLKYQDLNGDGIINVFDKRAIGSPNLPNTTLGLSLQAVYKGFSVSLLFQGSFNYSFAVVGTGIEPFQSQFQPVHQERWTPETASTANFPRLGANSLSVNSASSYFSDFWLVNAHYIRLKTVDIGYQLPTKMLPFKISNARIYMSAYNLFTWTNYNKYQQDPEITTNTAGDAYINQRVVNLGVQLGF